MLRWNILGWWGWGGSHPSLAWEKVPGNLGILVQGGGGREGISPIPGGLYVLGVHGHFLVSLIVLLESEGEDTMTEQHSEGWLHVSGSLLLTLS